MIDRELKKDLAKALGIPEEMIREYMPHGATYTVILNDFRKVEGVRRRPRGALQMGEGRGAVSVPAHLQLVYARPERATAAELRELAALLGLESVSGWRKRPLLKAVLAQKKALQEAR